MSQIADNSIQMFGESDEDGHVKLASVAVKKRPRRRKVHKQQSILDETPDDNHGHDMRWHKVIAARKAKAIEDQILSHSKKSHWVDHSIVTVGLVSPKLLQKFSLDSHRISPSFAPKQQDEDSMLKSITERAAAKRKQQRLPSIDRTNAAKVSRNMQTATHKVPPTQISQYLNSSIQTSQTRLSRLSNGHS